MRGAAAPAAGVTNGIAVGCTFVDCGMFDASYQIVSVESLEETNLRTGSVKSTGKSKRGTSIYRNKLSDLAVSA
jgi:hypothetical protein